MRRLGNFAVLALLAGVACIGNVGGGTADAGTADAGTADAGTADAGSADAGSADAGTADAGTADAGTADAGTADAGTADAGTADAGTADAGSSDAGTAGAAPAWFVAQTTGEWIAIAGGSGERVTDVVPIPVPVNPPGEVSGSPSSIMTAWTGGAVDQARGEYILCANGGHADYSGNEAYALALREAIPRWRRLSEPTPNNQIHYNQPPGASGAVNGDGRPRAMHSTFEAFGDGRVWFGLQNSYASPAGGLSKAVWSYNRDALGAAETPLVWTASNLGPWEFHGMVPTAYDGSALKFGVSVFDRIGHKVWSLSGSGANSSVYWSIDTQGATLGTLAAYAANQSFGSWGGWGVVAHDLRILVAGDSYRNVITVLDLEAQAWTQVSNVTGTGLYDSGSGGVYVAANHSIGVGNPRTTGRTIHRLQIPTKEVAGQTVYDPSGQWVWSALNPLGPTLSVAPGNSDTYTKWNIVEDMGNGQSALVVATDITGPTYVFKIPAAGL